MTPRGRGSTRWRAAMRPLAAAADVNDSRYDAPFAAWLTRTRAAPAHGAHRDARAGGAPAARRQRERDDPRGQGEGPQGCSDSSSSRTRQASPPACRATKTACPTSSTGRIGNARRLVGDSDIELRVPDVTDKTPPDKKLGAFERNEPFSVRDVVPAGEGHERPAGDALRRVVRRQPWMGADPAQGRARCPPPSTTCSPTTRSRLKPPRRSHRARGITSPSPTTARAAPPA